MKKIMIVDDEYYARLALTKTMDWKSNGFSIIGEADNGKTALEMLQRLHPDLILVDINMPIMNGLELIKEIRERKIEVEIIILTGYNDFAYAKQAINYSVSEYLLKPIVEEELLEAIKKVAKKIDENVLADVRIEESLHVLRREFLNNLINGKYNDEKIIENYFRNFSMIKRKYARILYVGFTEEENLNFHDFTNILKVLFPITIYPECWKLTTNKWGVVMFSDDQGVLTNEEIKNLVESLHRWLVHQENVIGEVKIGVGKIVSEVAKLSISYETSKELKVNETAKHIYMYEEEEGSAKVLVSRIKEYIEQELSNPDLSINEIEKALNFNYHYICKVFKKVMNIALGEYIISRRMIVAKKLIYQGDEKVDNIASKCGYTNPGYFGKAFKKYYGVSPKQMMKNK